MRKEIVLETLKNMPEEFSAEELIERIIFIDKIEKGRQDIREGKTLTLEQVKEQNRKWLK